MQISPIVADNGILRMLGPAAQEFIRIVKVAFVAGIAEHPPPVAVTEQRGIGMTDRRIFGFDTFAGCHARRVITGALGDGIHAFPVTRKITGLIEPDLLLQEGLGDHVITPFCLEDQRIGVMHAAARVRGRIDLIKHDPHVVPVRAIATRRQGNAAPAHLFRGSRLAALRRLCIAGFLNSRLEKQVPQTVFTKQKGIGGKGGTGKIRDLPRLQDRVVNSCVADSVKGRYGHRAPIGDHGRDERRKIPHTIVLVVRLTDRTGGASGKDCEDR